MKIIDVQNISKTYKTEHGPLKVLDDVSFAVPKNSWTMLIGASGSGKTTLLQMLGALDKPDNGKIFFDGKDLGNAGTFAASKIRRNGVGFVFQSFNLLPELNALENVMLPGLFQRGGKSVKQRALELLEMVNMSQRATHKPTELSGGEQQRVAIARALANDPKMILADEPTGNLDPGTSEEVFDILMEQVRGRNIGALVATHNIELADQMDKTFELKNGRLNLF